MNKQIKYIEMYKGKLSIKQTNDISKVIANDYGVNDDYQIIDLFSDNKSNIKMIIQKEYYPNRKSHTLIYKVNNEAIDLYKGKLFLLNIIDNKLKSLDDFDIRFIKNEITKNYYGVFVYNTYNKQL